MQTKEFQRVGVDHGEIDGHDFLIIQDVGSEGDAKRVWAAFPIDEEGYQLATAFASFFNMGYIMGLADSKYQKPMIANEECRVALRKIANNVYLRDYGNQNIE